MAKAESGGVEGTTPRAEEQAPPRKGFTLGGTAIARGTRTTVKIPIPRLYTHAELDIPVHVVRGRRPGPRLFVSAAMHGDEINGVEIIRRLLRLKVLRSLRGTLIAVPIVNVFGFIGHSRYLPDRRDLNRSFPGSEQGSLAARIANIFMDEIVSVSTHGIDLHTGSNHRTNLPQIRACMEHAETESMARAFGAPVILDSNVRDASLRQAALERGMPMLLYEAGEALRFDQFSIRIGLRGIVAVMRSIGMLPPGKKRRRERHSLVARSSYWLRSPISGILQQSVRLGEVVVEGQKLATVSDPLGGELTSIAATAAGIVIGRLMLPLAHQGDAVFHLARLREDEPGLGSKLEAIQEQLRDEDFAPLG